MTEVVFQRKYAKGQRRKEKTGGLRRGILTTKYTKYAKKGERDCR